MELSNEDQAYWKGKLRDEERRLSRRFMDEEELLRDTQENAANQPDDAVAMADREGTENFLHNLEEGRRRESQAIREAWERIDQGTFGTCVNCGQDIDPRRLEIVPYTHYCTKCEEDIEKAH